MEINKSEEKAIMPNDDLYSQTFYHGTKVDIKVGDLIEIGFNSNYGKKKKAKYILFSFK